MEHTENKKQESMDNNQIAMKVSAVSIAINLILSVLKLIAGIVAHSGAMVSDAIHSASDVGSTLIVIVGVRLSGKQSDQEHPYGHERMECVSSIILSGLLLATGIGIGISGLENIVKSTSGKAIEIPGMLALIAAVVSIVVKEWMFWYTRGAAKKINSGALMTRLFGSKIYVDLEIAADGTQTLDEAHQIAEHVHHAIEHTFPDVKHCMVHVNPAE